MIDEQLMKRAWEEFDRALGFDEKAKDTTKGESLRKMSRRAADKHLDAACQLEEEAFA